MPIHLFLTSLLTLTALQNTHALQFKVTNNAGSSPGGLRFTKEIRAERARQIMITTTNFIWNMLHQTNPSDRKKVEAVSLSINPYVGGAEAITSGENINVSLVYLQGYQGNLLWEFTSLIHHEMTHVWQWNGNGQTPAHYEPKGYAKPGQGEKWDQGYDFTARFFEYCERVREGFVAELNKKMKDSFSVDCFVELLGKPVDQL